MLSPHAEWVTRVDILLTCAPRKSVAKKKSGEGDLPARMDQGVGEWFARLWPASPERSLP
jgi:hypothetical protein